MFLTLVAVVTFIICCFLLGAIVAVIVDRKSPRGDILLITLGLFILSGWYLFDYL